LPEPVPTPEPTTGVERSKNPVTSNYGLRNKPARSYKGMLAGKRRLLGPKAYADAMDCDVADKWKGAMDAEIKSIWKNDTWELVPPPRNGKIVESCWVLHEKNNGIYKARFCAKGYTQQWGEAYDETFTPVAKYTSIRTLFAL